MLNRLMSITNKSKRCLAFTYEKPKSRMCSIKFNKEIDHENQRLLEKIVSQYLLYKRINPK